MGAVLSRGGRRAGPPGRCMRGLALMEVLVTMLLIALWVLASAGLQIGALKAQKSAGNRSLAVTLVGELSESMDANRSGANAGGYALAERSTASSADKDCSQNYCTTTELAAHDLDLWTTRAVAVLPVEAMSVVKGADSNGLASYTITIRWKEPRGRQTYATEGTTETLSYSLTKVVRDDDA